MSSLSPLSDAPLQHIVKLKDDIDMDAHIVTFNNARGNGHIVHRKWDPRFLNAYLGTFSEAVLEEIKGHPNAEFVTEDSEQSDEFEVTTQNDAGWGVSRINHVKSLKGKSDQLTNYDYEYDSTSEVGSGVDIYILDSGICTEHVDFGGRATWGITINGTDGVDVKGHGTHVASVNFITRSSILLTKCYQSGIAGGSRWGIAKGANLIAVKVLDDEGHGRQSYNLIGLEYVFMRRLFDGRSSIINMSYGGQQGQSEIIDFALMRITSVGIHVTVAAGNKNVDAKDTSPANCPCVNTVGATDINDDRYIKEHDDDTITGSNFGELLCGLGVELQLTGYLLYAGPCVDFFAPGFQITSCSIKKDKNGKYTKSTKKDGTSMAAPLVAGVIAAIISLVGDIPPPGMTNILKALCLRNILGRIPDDGTPNALIRGALHVPIAFSLTSDWASMAINNRNTTLSRIKANKYDENTSTTSKSVQYGIEGSRVYHDCTIPLMFVSVDLSVDISLCHGSDGKEDEDQAGMATATFASEEYVSAGISDNVRNDDDYNDCPLESS
ncbi:uncharacterized protein LACBIDRAFT_299797 [Laccaria bicolor S238N-H82]|uniref:Predicted protein n=1 Tax=Laccaria bicolor (strain S238N-H82 / ATCC MYA-4686) TaxID=486041 RepID=B0DFF8_LACBS|nr:uncharacterized protein LACBIDRAFT_299797 [Laccaria bicolor S238N-H82]EDR06698.1 predicted protein [Laccaria bicolor S238N-H82]|eukprot:XP_001882545.1 predicted protein [Laccaria bicolor S238N-H82]